MDIKNRSPAMAGPERSPELFCNIVLPFPLPVTHTFEQTSSYEQALQKLLKDPIRFLLATSHTFEDEAKMAPVLRPRKRLNESQAQQANRMNVSRSTSGGFSSDTDVVRRSGTSHRDGGPSKAFLALLGDFAIGLEPIVI